MNESQHTCAVKPEIHNTGIGNGVDSVDFIETFRVIVFHVH